MIELVETANRKVYLVGTAHVSQSSIEEVEKAFEMYHPDTVCVELCTQRYQSWQDKTAWQNLDIVKVFKQKKIGVLLVSLIFSAYQKKIGDDVKITPGAEMFRAIELANEKNLSIALVDRDVQITLNRLVVCLSVWDKLQLFYYLIASLFSTQKEEHKIDILLQKDVISELVDGMAASFPNIKTVIIDERDQIIAENINRAQGNTIVAIIGAGHLKGIKQYLNKANDIVEINKPIHQKKSLLYPLKWLVPLLIIGLIGYGYFNVDRNISFQMVTHWILYNGVLAAIGAFIANAHIITIVMAFIAAPITSINPFIGAGWVTGLTEAIVRKPKVIDFQRISDDIFSFKRVRQNNLTRILVVFILTGAGSTIGTFLGVFSIINLL